MITDDELRDMLALGHEQRGVEFKGAGDSTDRAFRAKVIRAALGMANRRDHGYIVLGIDDAAPQSGGPGLTPERAAEWMNYDNVASWFGEYADPALRFELAARRTHQDNDVVVIEVHEFEEIPILCKRDFDTTLKRGALYTRSHAKPETSDTHQHAELRELLDLAVEKGLRRFVERAYRGGAILMPSERSRDIQLFSKQLGDLA
ncbi:MAG: ATP-binding protein [Actinomycetota bacterium]|nr:ATP-binding protein [Actinomycetota bacterium]